MSSGCLWPASHSGCSCLDVCGTEDAGASRGAEAAGTIASAVGGKEHRVVAKALADDAVSVIEAIVSPRRRVQPL